MKAWKKLSLLLCLTFSFSTVATSCSAIQDAISGLMGGSSQSSVDLGDSSESSTDFSSVDETSDSSDKTDKNDGETTLALLEDRIVNGVDGVQSMKVDFNFENIAGSDKVLVFGSAILSTTDDGMDMKLNITMEDNEDREEEVLYYCDNYLYMYGVDENGDRILERAPEELDNMIDNAIHMASDGAYDLASVGVIVEEIVSSFVGMEAPEFALADMWELIPYDEDSVETLVSDSEISLYFDMSDYVNGKLAIFDGITMNSSLTNVLDCFLTEIDPTLNVATICTELAKLGPVTMNDVNEMLPMIIGVSSQTLLDELLANEMVCAVLAQNLGEETVEMLKGFDVEAFLATPVEEGNAKTYGDITLDDLVIMATGGEIGSVMLLVGAVQSELNKTTLSDIDDEYGSIEMLLTIVKSLEWKEFSSTLGAEFDGEGALTAFDWMGRSEVQVGQQGTLYTTAKISVSELSKEPVEIVITEDWEQEYWHCGCPIGCMEEGENVKYNKDICAYLCPECAEHYICPICNELVKDTSYVLSDNSIFHQDCFYGVDE
jgi:hypothetical protein